MSEIISFSADAKSVTAYDSIRAGIAEYKQRFQNLVLPDLQTDAGLAAANRLLRDAAQPRIQLDKVRKSLKEPVLAYGKLVDSDAKAILAEIEPIENALRQQVQREEQRREDEKARKLAEEQARVAEIRRQIDAIVAVPIKAVALSAAEIEAQIDNLTAARPTAQQFHEFLEEALTAVEHSVAQLQSLLAQARAAEEQAKARAEEQRITAQRDRLATIASIPGKLIGKAPLELKAEAARWVARLQATKPETFEEFSKEAAEAIASAISSINTLVQQADDAIELAELREAKARAERAATAAQEAAQQSVVTVAPAPAGDLTVKADVLKLSDTVRAVSIEKPAESFAEDEPASEVTQPDAAEIVCCIANAYGVDTFTARGWLKSTSF